MLIHSLVVLLLFATAATNKLQQPVKPTVTLVAPGRVRLLTLEDRHGGGGGGEHAKLPASRGRLARASHQQIVPPTVFRPPVQPRLAVEPVLVMPPDPTLAVNSAQLGDPFGKDGPLSNGPGSGGGIGGGENGGVGNRRGPGFGPDDGGGSGGAGPRGSVTRPVLLYKVDPEFSEEARKAKYQGTVLLTVEIDVDGKPHRARVIHGLGLGLDEKALEAVGQWKFRPGYRNGEPVAVSATVEVNFRLL